MSTLAQVLLAALMNSLGFTGEIKDHCATQDTRTVTELILPAVYRYYSCNNIEENSCDFLTKKSETITDFI